MLFKSIKKSLLLFLFFCLSADAFSQTSRLIDFEIPELKKGDQVIRHKGFSLLYNETYEQANWVAYELTANETIKKFERTNHFISDPLIITGSADNSDYMGSGYDRGHLAPAGDMEWSAESVAESFYYSNMSPQVPSFNRGIWEKLEEFVRNNAVANQSLYVVTGPVLKSGLKVIGHNQVAIPEYYYKVIIDYNDPEKKGIGFILANQESAIELSEAAVSIDEVEKLNQALAAIGCTGGEMEKNIGDVTTYNVDDSICDKGQFDIKFDNNFKIMKQRTHSSKPKKHIFEKLRMSHEAKSVAT